MTSPDLLVRLTCRNCGGDLKHAHTSGDRIHLAALLDCTECGAQHRLDLTLRTFKGVAA